MNSRGKRRGGKQRRKDEDCYRSLCPGKLVWPRNKDFRVQGYLEREPLTICKTCTQTSKGNEERVEELERMAFSLSGHVSGAVIKKKL